MKSSAKRLSNGQRTSSTIPRVAGHDGSPEVWAWPSALERIRTGFPRAINPEPYLAPSAPSTPMRAYRATERFDPKVVRAGGLEPDGNLR
jgi:hypothetical protein